MTFKIVQNIPDLTIASVGGISTTSPISIKTGYFRITPEDDAYIEIGVNPGVSTTSSSFWIAGKESVVIKETKGSQTFSGIQTGTSTKIFLKEGLGSTFEVDEYVSISGVVPSGINTSIAKVTAVDQSTDYYGYTTTRITTDWNTSSIGSSITTPSGELRKVLRIAALNDGTGANTIHITEVQVSSQG